MAWHRHRRQDVYYRSRRCGEQVQRIYIGSGEAGAMAERIDRCLRRERKRNQLARRRVTAELRQLLTDLWLWDRHTRRLMQAELLLRGFYLHHRSEWRRRQMNETAKDWPNTIRFPASVNSTEAFAQLVERANAGDKVALEEVRTLLNNNPTVVATVTDLEARCLDRALDLLCAQNNIVREAFRVKMETLERELAGPYPTPAIRYGAKRVVMAWLALQAADCHCADAAQNEIPRRWQDARDSAERRYLAALKTLEIVRLLPE